MTRRRGYVGYLLLLPAALWLGLFFVVPFYSLLATSLYDPSGSDFRGYEMTYHWQNYTDALKEYGKPEGWNHPGWLVLAAMMLVIAAVSVPASRWALASRERYGVVTHSG